MHHLGEGLGRRIVAAALSGVLLVSGVPTQALAEMETEIGLEEQSPAEELVGDVEPSKNEEQVLVGEQGEVEEESLPDDGEDLDLSQSDVGADESGENDTIGEEGDGLSSQATWETVGTCEWSITDGELVIRPINGVEGTLYLWINSMELPWYSVRSQIKSARFEGIVHAKTCSCFFYGCYELEAIDLSGLDLSSVTDMGSMFSGCSKLASLDLSGWDTSSATDMKRMFYGCSSLASLDVSGFDTSKVTDMGSMFRGCSLLKSLDLSHFDTSSCTKMWSMFSGCSSLADLDLSRFDTSSVDAMDCMFSGCSSLKTLDLAHFNTSKVERMMDMFAGCSSLEAIDVSSFDVSSVEGSPLSFAYSITSMFKGCSSLQSIDLSSFDVSEMHWYTEVFAGCESLKSITLNETFSYRSKILMGSLYFPLGEWVNGDRTLSVKESWHSVSLNDKEAGERFKEETEPFNAPNMAGTWVKKGSISIDGATVSGIATQTYTGKAIMPAVIVTLGGKELTKDIDYSLSYKDNVSAGTASVIVTGIGAYTGSKDVSFEIVAPAKTFPDVKASAWYGQVVGRAAGLGLVTGYADGRFGPDDNITRGQVAVILWRMAGQPRAGSGTKSFPDVKPGAYYYNAVSWASSAGVVSGYASGKFGPDDKVTREQLAVMLSNYAGKVAGKKVTGSRADFSSMKDASKVAGYAQPAVGWCFRNKILSGSQGNVLPKGNATRAQAAKMLVFLYDMVQ